MKNSVLHDMAHRVDVVDGFMGFVQKDLNQGTPLHSPPPDMK